MQLSLLKYGIDHASPSFTGGRLFTVAKKWDVYEGWSTGQRHAGTPGSEKVDALAGKAAERTVWSSTTSLAHLKLHISERFREAKVKWHQERGRIEIQEASGPSWPTPGGRGVSPGS